MSVRCAPWSTGRSTHLDLSGERSNPLTPGCESFTRHNSPRSFFFSFPDWYGTIVHLRVLDWAPKLCPGSSVAERLLGKKEVEGPIPSLGSERCGEINAKVPKRSTGADCKSAGVRLRRFESFPWHRIIY
jgi:hypothetical protein